MRERIFIIRGALDVSLEAAYERAFRSLGASVESFDLVSKINENSPLPRYGKWFQRVMPSMLSRANRDLSLRATEFDPHVLIFSAHPLISPGALAFFKASCSRAQIVLLWPDTLLNLRREFLDLLPMVDLVATYSKATIPIFERYGARDIAFLPFAGDQDVLSGVPLSTSEMEEYGADVSFAGGCRPEREAALRQIIDTVPEARVKIWGPLWDRQCADKKVLSKWQRRMPLGKDFAKVIRASKINLNVVDQTNGPGANMRMFEIPMAEGLQLASYCDEVSDILVHGEHLLYYRTLKEATTAVQDVLSGKTDADAIRHRGYTLVAREHTYAQRATTLLGMLQNPRSAAHAS